MSVEGVWPPPPIERRSAPTIPNGNDPADVPPATVGPPLARPGDPHGVEIIDEGRGTVPPRIYPSTWSGWPAEWNTPAWNGRYQDLIDSAWMCLDLNASILSTMPPYTVGTDGAITVAPTWISNPDPDLYTSWEEFAKQLFWDYQLGEVFVLCTARYANGWPARFHVLDPWLVNVEMDGGIRRYTIGSMDPGPDLLHIRYKSSTSDARGHGPLEAGSSRMIAAGVLAQYATTIVQGGGVPYYVIKHPLELDPDQVQILQDQWWLSRTSNLGMPAILSGGIEIEQLQMSPADMALLDLSRHNESRIAVLLGVPPFLVGLPSGGDSMTYSNVVSLFDYHWRAGLRPKASPVMSALSQWALPRGSAVEVNRDEYVRADPLVRAQTWDILIRIGVLTAEQVQAFERYAQTGSSATIEPAPEPELAGALT
jgi:HK97 family phage portal protein